MELGNLSPEEHHDLEQSMNEEEYEKQKELEREWILMYT